MNFFYMAENMIKRKKGKSIKKSMRKSVRKSVKKSTAKPTVHPHCFTCKKVVSIKKYAVKKIAGTLAKSANGVCPSCGGTVCAYLDAPS
jgi:hypothetical protein